MSTVWRVAPMLLALMATFSCSKPPATVAAAASVPHSEVQKPGVAAEALKGYPDSPGSREALEETVRAQNGLAPEERLTTILRYAEKPAGAKLLEAELARFEGAPSDALAVIETVRTRAPGTPVAASALAAALRTLRQGEPTDFLSKCQEVLDAPNSSEADKAVVLYTRAFQYSEAGQAKLGVLDALQFWATYPDKVRRMKASGRLAALVRDAGFMCEADMLEDSDEADKLAGILHGQFVPLREQFAGGQSAEAPRSGLTAYALHTPSLEAVVANMPEGEAPLWERAQFLGRAQRLVAYEGDLKRVVALCEEYAEALRGALDEGTVQDEALPLAYAETRAAGECLRKLLVDPHFVRKTATPSAGSTASMRSEQVLGRLSLLSLDVAERRLEKNQIDETRLAMAYSRHAETLKTINDSDNTIQAYRRYIEAHPHAADSPEFLKRIGEAYIALHALGSAADAFKELYERYPDFAEAPAAQLGRITCLYQSEAYEQAYEESAALCAGSPDHPTVANVLLLRGLCEAAMGMEDQASETMREIDTRFPSSVAAPQALLWLASRALSLQDYGKAKSCFQSLVDRYPNSDAGQQAVEYLGRLSKMDVEPRNAN